MKKHSMYFFVVISFLINHLPAQAEDQASQLLMTVPVIVSINVAINTPVLWKGREWQRKGDGKKYTWQNAKKYCQDLDLAGHTDWYLPTKDELKGLVYCSNGTIILYDFPRHPFDCAYGGDNYVSPTIDDSFSCYPDMYWSSTPGYGDRAWLVNFLRGASAQLHRVGPHYVRCVR